QVGRTLLIYTGGPEPHSTRTRGQVEILADRHPTDLSRIRASFESQFPMPAPGTASPLGALTRSLDSHDADQPDDRRVPADARPDPAGSSALPSAADASVVHPFGPGALASTDWEIV